MRENLEKRKMEGDKKNRTGKSIQRKKEETIMKSKKNEKERRKSQ